MSKYNGRKVVRATLESNIFIPHIGDIQKEVTSTPNALSKAIDMVFDEGFVIMNVKNKSTGQSLEVLVPQNRFIYIGLEPEKVLPLPKPFRD